MSWLFYLFLGLFTAFIGALPLGATNIAVINTTVKANLESAFKIIYPAALAELILVSIAFAFHMPIKQFVKMNLWVQIAMAIVFLIIGTFFIVRTKEHNSKERVPKLSNYVLGFSSALINPPVLIYWIIVMSFVNSHMLLPSVENPFTFLTLFLTGVFIGKATTLIVYGKFSFYLKQKSKMISVRLNKLIGVLLIVAAAIQILKIVLG